jgi:serine/threonine-protein kinase
MRTRTHIPELDPMIGRTIHEFRIEEKLAEGGMGAVYLGRHVLLPSALKVIKVLLPAYAANPVLRRRFHREAEAASKLKHEHILGIDNFGEFDDGQLFIMIPYLEGQPLDTYLRARGGRLVPHRALHIVVQLCDALDHAHSRGIIHRDLKPSNVYLVATNANPYAVKLLDFGVAKFLEEPAGHGTRSGVPIGTPSYMAVEQYEHGDEATHLADVYSLGIMIWEMVTGRLPWQAREGAVLYHLQRTVTPKRPAVSEMPLEWSRLLLGALSVDLDARPRSARELATALASALPADGRRPSGTEILAGLVPRFVRRSGPGDETVRNASDVDRLAPLLWPARETTGETDRAAPPELPPPLPSPPPLPPPPELPPPPMAELPAAGPGAPGTRPIDPRRSARRKLAVAALAATALAAAGIAARVGGASAPAGAPAAEVPDGSPDARGDVRAAAGAEAPTAGGLTGATGTAEPLGAIGTAEPLGEIGTPAALAAPQGARVAPRRAPGELAVYVKPWAMVSVNGRPVGQTPYRAKLPPGSYRVRMKNEDAEKDEVVTVTVTPGTHTTLRRTW